MAVQYYGAAIGAQKAVDVTEDTSTTSAVIELAVTYTTLGMSKHHVLNALSALREYILQDAWPPNT
jgi:hypothetical protein